MSRLAICMDDRERAAVSVVLESSVSADVLLIGNQVSNHFFCNFLKVPLDIVVCYPESCFSRGQLWVERAWLNSPDPIGVRTKKLLATSANSPSKKSKNVTTACAWITMVATRTASVFRTDTIIHAIVLRCDLSARKMCRRPLSTTNAVAAPEANAQTDQCGNHPSSGCKWCRLEMKDYCNCRRNK